MDMLHVIGRVLDKMPEEGDFSLAVVKGHLLAEEQLNKALASISKNPIYIENSRLTFSNLTDVCKAFFFDKEKDWVWGALKKLNHLRNLYAHSLEPEGVEATVKDFLSLVEPHYGAKGNTLHDQFSYCVSVLCSELFLLYEESHA